MLLIVSLHAAFPLIPARRHAHGVAERMMQRHFNLCETAARRQPLEAPCA